MPELPAYLRLLRLRHAILLAVTLLFAFAAIRLAHLDGLFRRVTIDGPSMALPFRGASGQIRCADCGISFRCDAEHLPADGLAACPNCGFASNPLAAAQNCPPIACLSTAGRSSGAIPAVAMS